MVQFVNCFEVPAGSEEVFLQLWSEVNAHMVAKPGYVSHRLHRSLAGDARYRFVNLAEWDTVDDWRGAHDAEFRALVTRPEWAPFSSTPALYEVVHQGAATT